MPLSALLGFTAGINSWFGMIVSLCVSLYALYLLYHGLVEALKAKPETAKIVMYVLAALMVLFMLLGMKARNKMEKYMDNDDVKELLKDIEK
jgi:DMSO/TMAO reductase YedYZ heme-binding membrane subunit